MQSTKVLHVGTLSDNLDGLGITQVKLVLDNHCAENHACRLVPCTFLLIVQP